MLRRFNNPSRRGEDGYTFVSHQQEVGTGYFGQKSLTIIQGGASSVTALTGSAPKNRVLIDARWRCAPSGLQIAVVVGRIRTRHPA